MSKRRIVCAAMRRGDLIVCGARHFDEVMHRQLQAIYGAEQAYPKFEQGFIDQKGVFLDRKEALKVAEDAGQIIKNTSPHDQLFSEDIY